MSNVVVVIAIGDMTTTKEDGKLIRMDSIGRMTRRVGAAYEVSAIPS
jgi:hypothetical protein